MLCTVEQVTREHCEHHDEMNITSTQGYIANSVTSDIRECMGASHPWVIYAQPGQRINLTLYDFAVEDPETGLYNVEDQQANIRKCRNYGIIQDNQRHQPIPICGAQSRLSHLHMSEGNVVSIWVTNDLSAKEIIHFVIKYEGT